MNCAKRSLKTVLAIYIPVVSPAPNFLPAATSVTRVPFSYFTVNKLCQYGRNTLQSGLVSCLGGRLHFLLSLWWILMSIWRLVVPSKALQFRRDFSSIDRVCLPPQALTIHEACYHLPHIQTLEDQDRHFKQRHRCWGV